MRSLASFFAAGAALGSVLGATAGSGPALAQPAADACEPSVPVAERSVGSQHRSYCFAEAGREMPYRLYVPTSWDGERALPLILFLHGAGSDENRYLDANDRQLERLAEEHGYILVAPLGYSVMGAFGAGMRLGSSWGEIDGQRQAREQLNADPARLRELELSELDTLEVLDRTVAEYGVNPDEVFLMGHSMGSGGVWYLGNKHSDRWAALAPMSGPFAEAALYPFANLAGIPIYYTEGVQTPSLEASRAMAEAAWDEGLQITYEEFDGDHGSMIPMAAPGVFEFFDERLEELRGAGAEPD
jgi:poly(3-hydroxybutyrate) depolymerase